MKNALLVPCVFFLSLLSAILIFAFFGGIALRYEMGIPFTSESAGLLLLCMVQEACYVLPLAVMLAIIKVYTFLMRHPAKLSIALVLFLVCLVFTVFYHRERTGALQDNSDHRQSVNCFYQQTVLAGFITTGFPQSLFRCICCLYLYAKFYTISFVRRCAFFLHQLILVCMYYHAMESIQSSFLTSSIRRLVAHISIYAVGRFPGSTH